MSFASAACRAPIYAARVADRFVKFTPRPHEKTSPFWLRRNTFDLLKQIKFS